MHDACKSITLMADQKSRWLWSDHIDSVSLPDEIINQVELWLGKYLKFLDHPGDEHLQQNFNAEGMNIARQIKRFIGDHIPVYYTPRFPHKPVKRGRRERVLFERPSSDFSGWCSKVAVHKHLSALDFIMETCEESGAVCDIEPEYYQNFINIDSESIRLLIRDVIFASRNYINDTEKWKTEESLFDRLCSTLLLIMSGTCYFSEDGSEIVFNKPSIRPTAEELTHLKRRAEAERGTLKNELWKILESQTKQDQ